MEKFTVHVLFLGLRNMSTGWPYSNFNIDNAVEKIKKEMLQVLGESDPSLNLSGWTVISGDQDLFPAYYELKEADGMIIVPLTAEFAALGPDIFKVCEADLPAIIYTPPFATYWDGFGSLHASGIKAVHVASSSISDIREPLKAMKAVMKLRRLRLLIIRDMDHDYSKIDPRMLDPRWKGPAYQKLIHDTFGTKLYFSESEELLDVFNSISKHEISREFEQILGNSKGTKEPPENEVYQAVGMYLAMKKIMQDNKCNGISVDCLSIIRENKHPVSPCLGISRLNTEEYVAGCEADVESTITLALCRYLSGQSGFQADPVIDQSKNQVLFAHCTAAPNMCENMDSPYYFRTHNESLSNVGVEVEMPVNKPVTILKILGTAVTQHVCWPDIPVKRDFTGYHLLTYESASIPHEYHESDRGCRTKLAVELPPDELEEFGSNFYGHHRIVVFGHYQKLLKYSAALMGIKYHSKMYLNLQK